MNAPLGGFIDLLGLGSFQQPRSSGGELNGSQLNSFIGRENVVNTDVEKEPEPYHVAWPEISTTKGDNREHNFQTIDEPNSSDWIRPPTKYSFPEVRSSC